MNEPKSKSISILDKDYTQWIRELSARYRKSQIKAAIKVNQEMLLFYWELGRDIVERDAENKYGRNFYASLCNDLTKEMSGMKGFSVTNLKYSTYFYKLYLPIFKDIGIPDINLPQLVDDLSSANKNHPQLVDDSKRDEKTNYDQRVVMRMIQDIFSIPWGHHRFIIDKCQGHPQKALFFVRQTVENGWSRNVLLNFLNTDLYERQGKAQTNFKRTLPDEESDLAQELTKDPYDFAFTGITNRYNERLLKDKLLGNITQFLLELGSGFAYLGKEYRLQVGERENFVDLLFYNLNLSCYVVVEVKIGKFEFADVGQLGGYVVACNHILRKEERDNPTIGLLICKEKDRIQAQYALESSSQPIGISEYELEKFYPKKVEGTIPTIEELETKLNERM